MWSQVNHFNATSTLQITAQSLEVKWYNLYNEKQIKECFVSFSFPKRNKVWSSTKCRLLFIVANIFIGFTHTKMYLTFCSYQQNSRDSGAISFKSQNYIQTSQQKWKNTRFTQNEKISVYNQLYQSAIPPFLCKLSPSISFLLPCPGTCPHTTFSQAKRIQSISNRSMKVELTSQGTHSLAQYAGWEPAK